MSIGALRDGVPILGVVYAFGYPDDAGRAALFDPIDANYTPLRGFGIVRQPGPNIVVWRLGPGPG